MGLLDPSEDDRKYEKKPRFWQDMIAYIILLVGGIGAVLYALLWTK